MSFYPAKGNGKKNIELCNIDPFHLSIPCNGDTVINVKDYDKDALLAVGITMTVPAISGSTWGGEGTYIKDHYSAQNGNGQSGKVIFDGTNIHIKQIPSAGTASVTQKVSCLLVLSYVK